MKPHVVWFGIGSLALVQTSALAQSGMIEGRVESVIGGDNLMVEINGQLRNVDLANMSPPTSGNWDQLAAQRLGELLPPGTRVMIQPGWERNGSLYGYVYGPDGLVNLNLIREGLSLPRWHPRAESLQQWYDQARAQAEASGAGYYGTTTATTTSFALPEIGSMLATIPAAIPSQAGPWGLGAVAVVSALMVARTAWKRWTQRPRYLWKQQQVQVQQDLTQALLQEKTTERRLQQVQQQAEECLDQAREALRQGKEEEARLALAQKQEHLRSAEQLQQQLLQVRLHTEAIRSRKSFVPGHPRED